jgi:hypothetical protein
MYTDPRGGSNRKNINTNFFKVWAPKMAYTLGLIISDGAIEDVRKSSRTCYIALTSKDKSLLTQIKKVLESDHLIKKIPPHFQKFKNGKIYLCSTKYILRIASKEMFQDLVNLGVTPRKSLTARLPSNIPDFLFSYLLRGYFDGDGCLSLYRKHKNNSTRIRLIFTSGSKRLLEDIVEKLEQLLNLGKAKIYYYSCAYRLVFEKYESLNVLSYMYSNLTDAPFLDRKYALYQKLLIGPKT